MNSPHKRSLAACAVAQSAPERSISTSDRGSRYCFFFTMFGSDSNYELNQLLLFCEASKLFFFNFTVSYWHRDTFYLSLILNAPYIIPTPTEIHVKFLTFPNI